MTTLLIVYLFALGITVLVFLTLYNAIWRFPRHPDYALLPQTGNTFAPRSDAARLARLKKLGYSIVLFSGDLALQKETDYFLRAAHLVLQTHPRTVLVIANSSDRDRQTIEQAPHHVKNKVFFSGLLREDDRHQTYAAADVFLAPSTQESFDSTALEAMRAGVPVLMGRQSGATETIENVIRVDFLNSEKLARHLSSLLGDPHRRTILGTRGQKEVAAIFGT